LRTGRWRMKPAKVASEAVWQHGLTCFCHIGRYRHSGGTVSPPVPDCTLSLHVGHVDGPVEIVTRIIVGRYCRCCASVLLPKTQRRITCHSVM
jgi:hypothetical protein